LAFRIRRATQRFPQRGYSELKAQIISSAESIDSTIVEGCGAATRKEFARYLDMSIKSATETEGHLQRAVDYYILSPEEWRSLTDEVVEIRRMLYGLRRTVLKADRDEAAD
jgi:four helix bundle protein